MVRCRQVTAEGDAENFECKVTGDAKQQRRRLDAVTSTAVVENDFLRLERVQRQITDRYLAVYRDFKDVLLYYADTSTNESSALSHTWPTWQVGRCIVTGAAATKPPQYDTVFLVFTIFLFRVFRGLCSLYGKHTAYWQEITRYSKDAQLSQRKHAMLLCNH